MGCGVGLGVGVGVVVVSGCGVGVGVGVVVVLVLGWFGECSVLMIEVVWLDGLGGVVCVLVLLCLLVSVVLSFFSFVCRFMFSLFCCGFVGELG